MYTYGCHACGQKNATRNRPLALQNALLWRTSVAMIAIQVAPVAQSVATSTTQTHAALIFREFEARLHGMRTSRNCKTQKLAQAVVFRISRKLIGGSMATPPVDPRVSSSMAGRITFNMGTQENCQKANEIIASSTLYDSALECSVTERWFVQIYRAYMSSTQAVRKSPSTRT